MDSNTKKIIGGIVLAGALVLAGVSGVKNDKPLGQAGNPKLVFMVYKNDGTIERVIVSDDYKNQNALAAAHLKGQENGIFVPTPQYELAKPEDIEKFLTDETGLTPTSPVYNVSPVQTSILSKEQKDQAKIFFERFNMDSSGI